MGAPVLPRAAALVAAHMSGTYIAYAITTPGKGCGLVRVVSRDSDDRILINGMRYRL